MGGMGVSPKGSGCGEGCTLPIVVYSRSESKVILDCKLSSYPVLVFTSYLLRMYRFQNVIRRGKSYPMLLHVRNLFQYSYPRTPYSFSSIIS